MWYRGGPTNVMVEVNQSGKQALGLEGIHLVRYQNGPILSIGDQSDAPDFKVLAVFRSENGIYKAQKNTMINTPAVVYSQFGSGRVIAISPHFESTTGLEAVVPRAIEFVAPARKTATAGG